MRVISLVPSWTETLIQAGVDVCGRTRFCIHPREEVKALPIVGGTKDIDWKKVIALKPELIILDQEENPKEFADQCPFPWIATHVTDLESARDEMLRLGQVLKNQKLLDWSDQWEKLLNQKCGPWSLAYIPGEIKKIGITSSPLKQEVIYLIWKNPWMAANHNTFIGSALKFLGAPMADLQTEKKYPELTDEILSKNHILFSSEPFPFHKKEKDLAASGFSGSLIDGEGFSWFGIRSLNFLTEAQSKSLVTKV